MLTFQANWKVDEKVVTYFFLFGLFPGIQYTNPQGETIKITVFFGKACYVKRGYSKRKLLWQCKTQDQKYRVTEIFMVVTTFIY